MIVGDSKTSFYITSQMQLDDVIALIRRVKQFAIDTEFTRQITYYPILSIIQIAVNDASDTQNMFIIDCISDLDLSGLFAIIADEKIVKIFHSSKQDLQIFYHKSKTMPKSIIDTQVMASFCGFGCGIGYSNLVKRVFGKEIDKNQQTSDWQRRPLHQKQIKYAFLDVFFLKEIYEKFLDILQSKNRFDWYLEEIKSFVNKALLVSQESLLKNFTFNNLSFRQAAQVRNLVFWREKYAQKINIPRQHFLKDEIIVQIIQRGVVKRNLSSQLNQHMVSEIEKILNSQEELKERPQRFYMNREQKLCFQKAKELIKKIAVEEDFSEQFLLTGSDLKKVICEKSLFDEKITGWRRKLFGRKLQELIL